MSVGSDHPLGSAAYMSEASLKKGPAWFLSTTLDAGRLTLVAWLVQEPLLFPRVNPRLLHQPQPL